MKEIHDFAKQFKTQRGKSPFVIVERFMKNTFEGEPYSEWIVFSMDVGMTKAFKAGYRFIMNGITHEVLYNLYTESMYKREKEAIHGLGFRLVEKKEIS